MIIVFLTLFGTLFGCSNDKPSDYPLGCEESCDQLVSSCEIEAFPSYESCLQGCAFSADNGADVLSLGTCMTDAECDLFKITECEHSYGVIE